MVAEAVQSDIEWIIQIESVLMPYSSYHIYTEESYKKSCQAYDDIFLLNKRPAYLDRIAAEASIIIAPQSENLTDKQHSPLQCIHIKDGSTIGSQSVYPTKLMAIVAALQLAGHIRITTKAYSKTH